MLVIAGVLTLAGLGASAAQVPPKMPDSGVKHGRRVCDHRSVYLFRQPKMDFRRRKREGLWE
ncbi:hypothetical protein C0989_002821 [Termitomyces sp. Mn162]|nr:hypothetical protein C0989_002821 [Termitomyces sp. Mn162]